MAKRNAKTFILPHGGEHPESRRGPERMAREGGNGSAGSATINNGSLHEERAARVGKPGESRVEVTLPRMDLKNMRVKLVGESMLVVHHFDTKTTEQILAKQMKKATQARDAKDPFQDFLASLYWISERPKKVTEKDIASGRFKFGFPAVAFKKAAVDACSFIEGVTKVEGRGSFHTLGDLVEILGPPPRMRRDMVRLANGSGDVRFRGEFDPWSVQLNISYNAAVIQAEQIAHMLNVAGFSIGVGEARPQKNGQWGRFRVG